VARSARTRVAELLIAALARANGLALCTRNAADLAGLDALVTVIAV
jgi:predicted nucleic acid-binding protein